MYRFVFENVTTGQRHVIRARDARAAIKKCERDLTGVFDCLSMHADISPLGEPLETWKPG